MLNGIRVLLVDDYADHQRLYAKALEAHGALVTPTGSIREAWSLFDWVEPHVLVSELTLIDGDACALVRWIRGRGPDRNGFVPAVALTASTRDRDRARARAAGFDEYCTKVAPVDEFVTAVARALPPLRKLA